MLLIETAHDCRRENMCHCSCVCATSVRAAEEMLSLKATPSRIWPTEFITLELMVGWQLTVFCTKPNTTNRTDLYCCTTAYTSTCYCCPRTVDSRCYEEGATLTGHQLIIVLTNVWPAPDRLSLNGSIGWSLHSDSGIWSFSLYTTSAIDWIQGNDIHSARRQRILCFRPEIC